MEIPIQNRRIGRPDAKHSIRQMVFPGAEWRGHCHNLPENPDVQFFLRTHVQSVWQTAAEGKRSFHFQRFHRNDQLAELSEGYPRDWRFYCPPRNGKIVCPSLLRRQFKSKPVPYWIPVSLHHQRCWLLQAALLHSWSSGKGDKTGMFKAVQE